MISWKNHFLYQVDYQHWATDVLFESLDKLSDEARRKDVQLYHKSIHATINHLLAANELWLERMSGRESTVQLDRSGLNDWRELKNALKLAVRQTQHFLEHQSSSWFEGELQYRSTSGHLYRNWVHDVLTHLGTDYAHYRGQLAAAAIRLGAPAPLFDYMSYRREMQQSLANSKQSRPE